MGIGAYRHVARFQAPGPAEPDGEGGFTETWADLEPPTWAVSIRPATVRDLERETAGTVITSATHVITGRYRPDVTTATRMIFRGRTFEITGVVDVDERAIEMHLIAEERI